ncbi:hypothetical protein MPDQ_007852 [Monascus purpureus]|uniref:Uncharacterized protein n=1 Tax=Monascus purpureus TaxID=5098 RepID=A0A507R4Z2_MONPU|nr:hypothetical protein MPDQ_007852 [Monascus purpureus]BDD62961.1 hypothetical protein MAP00_007912 [Monascus purpureus]
MFAQKLSLEASRPKLKHEHPEEHILRPNLQCAGPELDTNPSVEGIRHYLVELPPPYTNTDCIGIREALLHNSHEVGFRNKPALIRTATCMMRKWLGSGKIYN